MKDRYTGIFRTGKKLKIAIAGVVLEGFMTGLNFPVLFNLLNSIFTDGIVFGDVLISVVYLTIIYVMRLILYSVSYTGSQTGGAEVTRGIRIAIGDKLKKIPLGIFTEKRTGFYINAATSETADYEQILTHKLADIIKYTVLTMILVIYTCTIHPGVGAILFVTLILLIPVMILSVKQVNHYGKAKNLAREENVSSITEYLTGSQTLRSYALAGTRNVSLTESMRKYSEISYRYEKAVLPIGFGYVYLVYIGIAVSLILMTNALRDQYITAPQLIIIMMLLLFVSKVEMSLYISLVAYRNLTISRKKIESIFEEKEEMTDGSELNPGSFDIEFKAVDFSYTEGEKVLAGMSFTIRENQLTAIVGESGSGKSTIFNLISKYYKPDHGTIRIGGTDIREISAEEVLRSISMVDQEVFLFDDTVMNNIRYARENASDAEVIRACKLANCHDFIMQMENGYDTVIGENGNRLSGGERQRLSIARAILRNSPIILLDEVTASLDIENELLVKRAIKNLLKTKRTVIMIAHTMSIVENADCILVVDQGKIAECGSHERLMRQNGKYAQMCRASRVLQG
ncbi:MAG: ABC transporter ATP-binding protein/permease [Lachnospiraceae bacterium]|nr:ABC transporter ATP-binding protein/permease [Lachnospiraceae bacterium]